MEETQKPDKKEPDSVPATKEQLDFLRSCVENKIRRYKIKRTRNKAGAIIVQVLVILFSFGTTVLIGWKLSEKPRENKQANTENKETSAGNNQMDLTNIALIVSALATGVVTLDKFFDYKALWIGYNISIAKLRAIQSKLGYISSLGVDTLTRSDLNKVFDQYESVCENMDKNYQEIRSARDE